MIKTIYIIWFQGFDNCPEIVKICVKSWKKYNTDWNIVLLDNNNLINYVNLEYYIHDIYNKSISKTHLSDIFRSLLLKLYGGLYVDATTFCNKPLNDWLPNYIKKGFFAFSKPGPDRLISSWFLYSNKNNYIIDKWCNSILKYYTINNKSHTYFIYNYLFNDLYNSDNRFKKIFDKVPKLSANGFGPHYLQQKGMFNKISIQNKLDIDNKITPLYKLTYKCHFPKYDETILLYYLYSTI
jgi:hypothetical protein